MFYYIFLVLIIVGLVLFLFLAIPHIFTFVFLYIEHSLGRLQHPELYPYIPPPVYTKACMREFIYMAGKYYLYPVKFLNLTLNNQKPNSTAILLIHGYDRNQSDWLWFRKQLVDLQYPIHTVNLSPSFASIEQITIDSLSPAIKKVQQETGCQKIILICHSMGGLAASYYSEHLDTANLVQAIINIGTPFHGSKLSVAAAGDNAKQMCPGASFTKDLRLKISQSQKPYFIIMSELDNIVYPWQSALLDFIPANRQYRLHLESHLGLLHSPAVVKQIKDWVSAF